MKRRTRKIIYNIFACLLLVVAIAWVCEKFIHLGNVEYTENAQVKQLIIPVNSRVQGFIEEIRFEEFQRVSKGDTLLIIENTEFRHRVAQAVAAYANAVNGKSAMKQTISTTQTDVTVSEAAIEEARIRMDNAERNYQRYKSLFEKDAVTQQQYDNVQTEYEAAKARYEMLQRQRESLRSVGKELNTRLDQNEAAIRLAEADVELAKLNLSYTIIVAPCDGYVGRKSIQEGQLIQPGQTVVDIVDSEDKWIVANYKETQTANICEGQEVDIEVDAVPDVVFKGRVLYISQATGASFSLMPQDNSSGNFIKIEQRIPVKIVFTEENDAEALARVRAGMNVEVTIHY